MLTNKLNVPQWTSLLEPFLG